MAVDDVGQVGGGVHRRAVDRGDQVADTQAGLPGGASGSTCRTTAPAGPPNAGASAIPTPMNAESPRCTPGAGAPERIWLAMAIARSIGIAKPATGDTAHPVGQRRGHVDADHLTGAVHQRAARVARTDVGRDADEVIEFAGTAADSSDARTDAPSWVMLPGA